MFEPNVLNYFLVLLGGFGVVWSYRHTAKRQDKHIGEFEYAAFSTLWGIPVFFVFIQAIKSKPDLLSSIFALPMAATPVLFVLGVALGYLGAQIIALVLTIRKYFEDRSRNKSL